MSNLHPCAGKCSEFKDGGQCFHCLINETVNQGVYAIGRINSRQDDTPMATRTVELKKGDCVVFKYNYQPHLLMTIEAVLDGGRFVGVDGYRQAFAAKDFRHATTQEIQANKRFNHIVEPNDMVDDASMGTRTVDIESENERLKTENLAMQVEIDLLKEALDIKESLNNALRARDEARQSMPIKYAE